MKTSKKIALYAGTITLSALIGYGSVLGLNIIKNKSIEKKIESLLDEDKSFDHLSGECEICKILNAEYISEGILPEGTKHQMEAVAKELEEQSNNYDITYYKVPNTDEINTEFAVGKVHMTQDGMEEYKNLNPFDDTDNIYTIRSDYTQGFIIVNEEIENTKKLTKLSVSK